MTYPAKLYYFLLSRVRYLLAKPTPPEIEPVVPYEEHTPPKGSVDVYWLDEKTVSKENIDKLWII